MHMNHVVRIALLDMNNNFPNQGMKNIVHITEHFKQNYNHPVEVKTYDVRYKNQWPNIADFDIMISSGGPGNPHREGHAWEQPYADLLTHLLQHNQLSSEKKFGFLICHSFQLAVIHWKIANVCKRKSYSFGVMPIHKTDEGKSNFLLKNLPEPFHAVDSRAYQCIEANSETMSQLGMETLAIEKMRPHIHLERALMAVKFSDELYGTQFHPEANPDGMLENLKDESNKAAMIKNYGLEKYLETVDRIDDPDKIVLTQQQILPRFLKFSADHILKDR